MKRSFVTINLENLFNQLGRMPDPSELAQALTMASGEEITPLMAMGFLKSLHNVGYLKFDRGNYEIIKATEPLPLEDEPQEVVEAISIPNGGTAINPEKLIEFSSMQSPEWKKPEVKTELKESKFSLRYVLDRGVYYSIGATDLAIGAVAFSSLGHTDLIMAILSLFGAVITFGRVSLYRRALIEPKKNRFNINRFYIGWVIGIILSTYFCVSFEVTTIEAQNNELTRKVAEYTENRQKASNELLTVNPRIDKLANDIDKIDRSWDNRTVDVIRSELKDARARKGELEAILKIESPSSKILASKLFSVLFGENNSYVMIRLMMLVLQIFMELYLAVFSVRLPRKEVQGE